MLKSISKVMLEIIKFAALATTVIIIVNAMIDIAKS